MEMRKVYAATLAKLMKENEKIVILDADLAGACGTKPLYEQFPNRCFDVGIAECNMAGIAAGMASYGYVPFIHTFAPFAARRAFDQIAVSIIYSRLKVVIVGTDPGVWTAANGGTHMSFEDVAAMRALPGMVVFEPVAAVQLEKALPQIVACQSPVYLRLARKETEPVFGDGYEFDLFKADKLAEGGDLTIIVSGICAPDCVEAAKILKNEGINVDLINMHTIKPLDREAVLGSAKRTKRVLTVENANYIGGLYGAVAELLSKELPTRCDYVAVNDELGEVGKTEELKIRYGLTKENILDKARKLVGTK